MSTDRKLREVLVIIGAGGMGHAIARRIGAGKAIVLADNNDATLENATECLGAEGHFVVPRKVDVTSTPSVHKLATSAAKLGVVTQVAHTAGLSPSQAETAAILAVDLLGVALVLDEFGTVIAPGGAGIVVSSMAAHLFPPLSADQQDALAHTPASELLPLPFLNTDNLNHPASAYGLAKQANHLRVAAAAPRWGERAARVNSISPGIISTPDGSTRIEFAAWRRDARDDRSFAGRPRSPTAPCQGTGRAI